MVKLINLETFQFHFSTFSSAPTKKNINIFYVNEEIIELVKYFLNKGPNSMLNDFDL